jgi:hypothetical protein
MDCLPGRRDAQLVRIRLNLGPGLARIGKCDVRRRT